LEPHSFLILVRIYIKDRDFYSTVEKGRNYNTESRFFITFCVDSNKVYENYIHGANVFFEILEMEENETYGNEEQ
jgi:hypothetical protein